MAFSGQVLDNPISGERFTLHKVARDTNGEALVFDLELSPDGRVPGAHVHPTQEERFEVTKGTMKFRKGMRTVTARAGDTVTVPPATVHRFKNVGEESASIRVEVRPALRMEQLFEAAVGLARDGRTTATGMPYPLELALFMEEFEAEVRAPYVPAVMVRAVMSPLARLARRRGLDSRYLKPVTSAPRSRDDLRRPPGRSADPRPKSSRDIR